MNRWYAVLLSVLAAIATAPAARAQLQTPLPSPNATAAQTVGVTRFEVAYSRPHVKGPSRKEDRVIWGKLVPYEQIWRTGANAVTKFTVDTDVMVEGQKLPAGSYGLFTIPGRTEWTVIFNRQSTGSPTDYKAEADVLRVKVKPEASAMRELFTIGFPQVNADSAVMTLDWEKLSVPVNLVVDTKALFLANARDAVARAKTDDWRTPLTAARYLHENKYAADDASAFLARSLSVKETFANVALKAGFLADGGKTKEAVAAAEQAMALKDTEPKPSPEAVAELEKKLGEWKSSR